MGRELQWKGDSKGQQGCKEEGGFKRQQGFNKEGKMMMVVGGEGEEKKDCCPLVLIDTLWPKMCLFSRKN